MRCSEENVPSQQCDGGSEDSAFVDTQPVGGGTYELNGEQTSEIDLDRIQELVEGLVQNSEPSKLTMRIIKDNVKQLLGAECPRDYSKVATATVVPLSKKACTHTHFVWQAWLKDTVDGLLRKQQAASEEGRTETLRDDGGTAAADCCITTVGTAVDDCVSDEDSDATTDGSDEVDDESLDGFVVQDESTTSEDSDSDMDDLSREVRPPKRKATLQQKRAVKRSRRIVSDSEESSDQEH